MTREQSVYELRQPSRLLVDIDDVLEICVLVVDVLVCVYNVEGCYHQQIEYQVHTVHVVVRKRGTRKGKEQKQVE